MQGLISPEQGQRLAELAAFVPAWAAIVEIGTHTGLSTCYMAHAASAQVYAVDPWEPPRPGSSDDPFGLGDRVYERFSANITAEGLWPRVTPLAGYSVDVARIWRKPIGLLFIDSVHTEEAVREDVEVWLPYLIDVGWLALHDYDSDPAHDYYGVSVVADDLAAEGWRPEPLVGSLWTARRA